MPHFFGAHTIDNGGIHMAVKRAARSGMRAMQLFSAKPQFYNDKISVKPERAKRFAEALDAAAFDRRFVIVHSAYVLNTASPEADKQARARAGLAKELERSAALGVHGFCFHPGSAGSSDPTGAIERIAEAMTFALESVPGTTRVFVENTAGAGRTMGRTAEEIAGVLTRIPGPLRPRSGYGLDTCHLYSSGHDITRSQGAFVDVLDRFEETIGAPPAFFHLNDSEGDLGSNRDRHVLLGDGKIGVEPFRWLVADRRSRDIPLILETPQENMQIGEEDDTPDPYDVRMIRLLESLV
jgi:deoxyribonuclease IV